MTFATDPAVLRVVAALGDARAARALVRALVTVAPRAQPWVDGWDIMVTCRSEGWEAEGLVQALVQARLVVQGEGGIVLTPAGEELAGLLEAERAAAVERKRRQRDEEAAVTFRDRRVTSCESSVTFCPPIEEFSSEIETESVTAAAASGASPITRAPGARGNSPSPSTPPTASSSNPASSRSASPASSPASNPDPGLTAEEAHRIATSLRRYLLRYITAPPALADDIADDLLAGRVTPDELMAAARAAPRTGGKNYNFLLAVVETHRREAEQAAEEESRGPPRFPLPNDPIPIEARRLVREFEQRSEGYEE